MWCGIRGDPGQHRLLGHGQSGHISSISRLLGLVAWADRCGAAGAAPVCCCATPVGGAGGRRGVHAAVLHGVLVFAVDTAGSGVVAGATGAVVGTAGGKCAGGAPGHSGVAGLCCQVECHPSSRHLGVARGCGHGLICNVLL